MDIGIKVDKDFSLEKTLGDPVKIRQWNSYGLPSDPLSIQNGLFVEWGRRWPLMIDPQSQGLAWIRSRESKNSIRTTQLTDKRFRNYIKYNTVLRGLHDRNRVGKSGRMARQV